MPEWPVRRRPTPQRALQDIGSSEAEARLAAIDALSDAPEELEGPARQALIRALEDPVPRVREAAALALAELGPGSALDRLIELAESADARVAQAAVIALGESGDRRALPPILAALESSRADVRFQAVLAVARLAPDEAFEHLRRATEDPDPEVRANALAALADTAGDEAIGVMRALLADLEPAVRVEAALALAARGDQAGVPTLIRALRHRDAAPQAVRALGGLRAREAVPALTELCRRWLTRPPLRAAAAAALAAMDDPFGRVELIGWLRARRREPRAMAIYSSGELKIQSAVEHLIEILRDRAHPDRDAAARALGEIADPRARDPLELAAADPDPIVAEDAREALEKIDREKSRR